MHSSFFLYLSGFSVQLFQFPATTKANLLFLFYIILCCFCSICNTSFSSSLWVFCVNCSSFQSRLEQIFYFFTMCFYAVFILFIMLLFFSSSLDFFQSQLFQSPVNAKAVFFISLLCPFMLYSFYL